MVRKKPRVSFPVFSPVDRNLCIIFVKIIRKHPNITLLHFTISWYQITYCKPFHSIKVRNYHQISILLGSRCRWWKWRGQPLLQLPVSQNMSFLSISHISICVPNIEEVITRLMVTMAMTKKLMEKICFIPFAELSILDVVFALCIPWCCAILWRQSCVDILKVLWFQSQYFHIYDLTCPQSH